MEVPTATGRRLACSCCECGDGLRSTAGLAHRKLLDRLRPCPGHPPHLVVARCTPVPPMA